MDCITVSREDVLPTVHRLMQAGVRAQVEKDGQSIILYRLGRRSDKLVVQYEDTNFRMGGHFVKREELTAEDQLNMDRVLALLKQPLLPSSGITSIFISVLYVYRRAAGAYFPANSEIFALLDVQRRQFEFMSLDGQLVGEGVNVWKSKCQDIKESLERWSELDTPPAVKVEINGKEDTLEHALRYIFSQEDMPQLEHAYLPWEEAYRVYGLQSLQETAAELVCHGM